MTTRWEEAGRLHLQLSPEQSVAVALEEAGADPRWPGLRTLSIRGMADADVAALAAAPPAPIAQVEITHGSLGNLGACGLAKILARWPLTRVSIDRNRVGRAGILAMRELPGFEAGYQQNASRQLDLYTKNAEWVEERADLWADRLISALAELAGRVGQSTVIEPLVDAAKPRRVERRWDPDFLPALAQPVPRTPEEIREERLRAARGLQVRGDGPAERGLRHAIDLAASSLESMRNGFRGDYGDDAWWAVQVAEALIATVGAVEAWDELGVVVLWDSPAERARVFADLGKRRPPRASRERPPRHGDQM